MKKIKFIVFSLFLICAFSINVCAQNISWYCIRKKDHIQPELDSRLDVIEKYDVYWIDKKHSDMNEEKVIYLTFDAGYENGNVEKIVDILNEENVKAAFFVLDNLLIKNKDLVNKMILNGHTVANHTLKHKDMTTVKNKESFAKELYSLEELYKKEYGLDMEKYYRPPEGKFNEENLKWAKELGYKTVMWSFAYADWDNQNQMSAEKAMDKILSNVHNGEVMLLHPTSSTNVEIMRDLIKNLKAQGFRFGTIEELCCD